MTKEKLNKLNVKLETELDEDIIEILDKVQNKTLFTKTAIRLANVVGVVDSDFYNNPDNEGHIFIKFYNPTDNDYEINIGDKIAQGIFTKYLIVDDEEEITTERSGGLGSTGK